MGLYEKAQQYMYDKKMDVLSNLRRRNFRNVFKEDEHLISSIIKECSFLLAKSEDNQAYITSFISSFISNESIMSSADDYVENFVSILKNIFGIGNFAFYSYDDEKYVIIEECKSFWECGSIVEFIYPKNIDTTSKNNVLEDKHGDLLNILSVDFLDLNDNVETTFGIETDNLESIAIFDKKKPLALVLFASRNINFTHEEISDYLKLAGFLFYYFYNIKLESKYKSRRNMSSHILIQVDNILNSNGSVYINTFKLKNFTTPKKFDGNYIDLYEDIDNIIGEADSIDNIFYLGNYNYITITDNATTSKRCLNEFKFIIDKLKKNVFNSISFHIHSIDYPSKKFDDYNMFIEYLLSILRTGEAIIKPSTKKSTASIKKAVKPKSPKSIVSENVDTTNNVEQQESKLGSSEIITTKKSTSKKK